MKDCKSELVVCHWDYTQSDTGTGKGVEGCPEAFLRTWSSLGKEGQAVGYVFVPGLLEWLVRKLQLAIKERAR